MGGAQGPQPQAPRRRDQGGGLGPGRLAAAVRDQSGGGRRTDQLGGRGGRGGGCSLGPVGPLLAGVHQAGQAVGEALLGQRVAVQAQQHLDRLRGLGGLSGGVLALLVLVGGVQLRGVGALLEDQDDPLLHGVAHGLLRVAHRTLGERRPYGLGVQRGVALEGGALQQPADQRRGAAPVVRAARGSQQGPGEAVRLLGPDARHRQQLPGVGAQQLGGLLAQGPGGRAGQGLGGPALGEDRPHRVHGLGGGCQVGGCGRGGHGALRLSGEGRGGAAGCGGGGGGVEELRARLLAALHGPYGCEEVGGGAAQLRTGGHRAVLLRLALRDPLAQFALGGQLGLCFRQHGGGRRVALRTGRCVTGRCFTGLRTVRCVTGGRVGPRGVHLGAVRCGLPGLPGALGLLRAPGLLGVGRFGVRGAFGVGGRRGLGALRCVRADGAGGLPGKRSHSVLQSWSG
ncbi:hypothetical protein SMICM304S_06830 [Streptomyces microflavus]